MFSVTAKIAMKYLGCIEDDRSKNSVEEYLEYIFNNCVVKQQIMWVVCDLATANCSCSMTPVPCISSPYRRPAHKHRNGLIETRRELLMLYALKQVSQAN